MYVCATVHDIMGLSATFADGPARLTNNWLLDVQKVSVSNMTFRKIYIGGGMRAVSQGMRAANYQNITSSSLLSSKSPTWAPPPISMFSTSLLASAAARL